MSNFIIIRRNVEYSEIVTAQVLFFRHPGKNRDRDSSTRWIPAFAGMTYKKIGET